MTLQRMSISDALAPVQEALLRAAHEEAQAILATADETAHRLVAEAHTQADQIRGRARARGTADAAELVAAERSRVGRQARAVVLDALRVEYEALRGAAREAVARLRDEPDYPALRRRMAGTLVRMLGDGAQVHDAPGGGVTATAPGRSADFSLARLTDRTVDAVLAEDSDAATLFGLGTQSPEADDRAERR